MDERAQAIMRAKARVIADRRQIEERCKVDGLWWARNHTKTFDEHAAKRGVDPYKPFPNLAYMDLLWQALLTSKRLFIPKSREMMTSWLVAAYVTWLAQWTPQCGIVVQTQNEDKAKRLVSYCKALYDNQAEWMRQNHPLTGGELTTDNVRQKSMAHVWESNARIDGVPSGAHQIRSHHPSVVVFDEAAHLSEFSEAYDTTIPVADQIIAISSAGSGSFADFCSEDAIEVGAETSLRAQFGLLEN